MRKLLLVGVALFGLSGVAHARHSVNLSLDTRFDADKSFAFCKALDASIQKEPLEEYDSRNYYTAACSIVEREHLSYENANDRAWSDKMDKLFRQPDKIN
jgi:hypothetical protein